MHLGHPSPGLQTDVCRPWYLSTDSLIDSLRVISNMSNYSPFCTADCSVYLCQMADGWRWGDTSGLFDDDDNADGNGPEQEVCH